ncbi:MAG: GntR family transcriptional regulator [Pseudomonadota bacterium]
MDIDSVVNKARKMPQDSFLTPEPLYKHVKNQIIDSLTRGEWRPGEMLPSEPKLAERYGVGISTIRAALGELAAAGVLVRKQGKGTFVAVHGEQRSVYQFFHVVRNDGTKELPVSELLQFKKAHADDEVADLLQLPRSGPRPFVYKLCNVLRVQGTPVVVSDIVIPAKMFPGLTEEILRTGGKTLYAVYQKHFGVHIVRTVEQLRATKADAIASRIFSLLRSEPILEVRRIAYTFNGIPVEVRRSRVDTRHYHYRIEQGNGT